MSPAVRAARSDEAAAIVPLYAWLFAPPGSRPAGWSVDVATERLRATIAGDRSTVLVAADGATLVGFATVYLDLVSVRFGQRAWVEDLAVDPGRRSAGVGRALLTAAQGWARAHGAAKLGLESGLRRVDAHRFYEREQPTSMARSFGWTL